MARNARIESDEHAMRILAAVDKDALVPFNDDDDADFNPIDAEVIARMRSAIDRAFEDAWARVRAQSAAEVARDAARSPGFIERTKAQLLARIETLRIQLGGQLQLAHRKLCEMNEDDLRSLVSDLEDAANRNVARS